MSRKAFPSIYLGNASVTLRCSSAILSNSRETSCSPRCQPPSRTVLVTTPKKSNNPWPAWLGCIRPEAVVVSQQNRRWFWWGSAVLRIWPMVPCTLTSCSCVCVSQWRSWTTSCKASFAASGSCRAWAFMMVPFSALPSPKQRLEKHPLDLSGCGLAPQAANESRPHIRPTLSSHGTGCRKLMWKKAHTCYNANELHIDMGFKLFIRLKMF